VLRSSIDSAELSFGFDSPEAIIARNNFVGFLLQTGRIADLEEARALAASVEGSLVATLGERHPASRLGRSNAAAVAAAIAAAEAAAEAAAAAPPLPPLPLPLPTAPPLPSPPPPPPPADPLALLRPLAGRWLIDEGASQDTAELLRYFGAPWLVIKAVVASATPPMVIQVLTERGGGVRVTYPGAFKLQNDYFLLSPSTHSSAFSKAQACTVEASLEPPGFVVRVPQAPGKGTLILTHALVAGRMVCSIVIRKDDGAEPVRIPRVYDRDNSAR
jgi:hypothetical protein